MLNIIASVDYTPKHYAAAEVSGLRVAQAEEVVAGAEMLLSLPQLLGERAIAFYGRYLADPAHIDRNYNCHTFTAALQGWLPIGATDPNICGWGAADLLEADTYQQIDPEDIKPGMAVGLTVATAPQHLVHSFTGIDGGRHVAVRANGDRMIIADNATVLRHYERKFGSALLLHAMDTKPSIMGTDRWQDIVYARYPGKPHRALAKIVRARAFLQANN